MTGDGSEKSRLRFLTYLVPDIPLDTFCIIRECIEDATGLETDLIIEDRFTGPTPKRADPSGGNLADILTLHTSDYLRMRAQGYDKMELCPAAPVHKHPLARDRPVYFSDIIVHASNRYKYKTMQDLKGCSWAYSSEESLSGNIMVLKHLRSSMATTPSHFGNVVNSGSHLNSIKMVKNYTVDAAAVNSVALAGYLREHEECVDKITSILSLGPIPAYPMLFSTQLSNELKQSISESLLLMHKSHTWASKLNDIGISKYVAVDSNLYFLEDGATADVQSMNVHQAYY